jgi:hypothetical protein
MSIDLWHGDFGWVFARENLTTFEVVIDATTMPLQKFSEKERYFCRFMEYDAPPNSLKDSNVSPKMKTTKGVGICSLPHNILGVRRLCGSSGMRIKMSDK